MASMVLRQHGDRAPVVVAERIGQLASEGKAWRYGRRWRGGWSN